MTQIRKRTAITPEPRGVPAARLAPLILSAASLAAAGVTLTMRGGLGYVNLESALGDSLVFYVCLVLPVTVAVACFAASVLPRLVTINLAITVALIAMLDVGTRLLVSPPLAISGDPEAVGAPAFFLRDATLGYVLAPSAIAHHRRIVGNTPIYDVTYRTDGWGRRETPARGGRRKWFLLFFGDSNVFGEGLSQSETLPYYAGEAGTDYRPYNYGVPGWGPSQTLDLARLDRLRGELKESEGYAVFFVIPAHVSRVIGSSLVSTGWGRHFPYYVEGDRGELVRLGDFTYGRPFTTLAYFFWTKSAFAERLGIELPIPLTEGHYRLTARVLHESSRLFADQLHLRGSVIVLSQAYTDTQRRIIDGVREALAREGAPYFDYTRLFDVNDPQYRLSDLDYHNSARANRVIAQRLVADLAGLENGKLGH